MNGGEDEDGDWWIYFRPEAPDGWAPRARERAAQERRALCAVEDRGATRRERHAPRPCGLCGSTADSDDRRRLETALADARAALDDALHRYVDLPSHPSRVTLLARTS